MSATYDESKHNRAGDGKFATKDGGREAAGQVGDAFDDLDGFEECPLCHAAIDYCQGHGEWNSSQEMTAALLHGGDRVWDDDEQDGRTVSMVNRDGNDIVLTFDDDTSLRLGPDDEVQVLEGNFAQRCDELLPVKDGVHVGRYARLTPDGRSLDARLRAARDMDGFEGPTSYAQAKGRELDDDLRREYEAEVANTRQLMEALGDRGYAELVMGHPDAQFWVDGTGRGDLGQSAVDEAMKLGAVRPLDADSDNPSMVTEPVVLGRFGNGDFIESQTRLTRGLSGDWHVQTGYQRRSLANPSKVGALDASDPAVAEVVPDELRDVEPGRVNEVVGLAVRHVAHRPSVTTTEGLTTTRWADGSTESRFTNENGELVHHRMSADLLRSEETIRRPDGTATRVTFDDGVRRVEEL